MDVLARLATEEPDLSGLPGELAELIGGLPAAGPARMRPTSSAMLAQLGQFTETRPGAAGEHSYLPEAAMALIAQYQRNPLLANGQPAPGRTAERDATSASYTELPASYQPKPRHQRAPAPAGRLAGVGQDTHGLGRLGLGRRRPGRGRRHPRRLADRSTAPEGRPRWRR